MRWRASALRRVLRQPVVWWLLVIVLSGITASTVQRDYAAAAEARLAWGEATPVLVAIHDLAAGDLIAPGAELRQWPRAMVPAGALAATAPDAVARFDLIAGEAIHADRVSTTSSGQLADRLPDATVALAVPVHSGVPPLSIGDRVDLFATFDGVARSEATDATQRVAQAAVVVDLGEEVITVAVPDAAVAATAGALARAEVTIALTGRS